MLFTKADKRQQIACSDKRIWILRYAKSEERDSSKKGTNARINDNLDMPRESIVSQRLSHTTWGDRSSHSFFNDQSRNLLRTRSDRRKRLARVLCWQVTLLPRLPDKLRDANPRRPKIQFWTRGACNGIVRRTVTARAEADISAARRYIHCHGTIRRSRSAVDYPTEPIVDSLYADLCTRNMTPQHGLIVALKLYINIHINIPNCRNVFTRCILILIAFLIDISL